MNSWFGLIITCLVCLPAIEPDLSILAVSASLATVFPVRYILRQGSRLAFLYTAAAALFLLLFGRPLIRYLYRPEFLPAFPALLILLAGFLVANSFYWNRTALLALGLSLTGLSPTARAARRFLWG